VPNCVEESRAPLVGHDQAPLRLAALLVSRFKQRRKLALEDLALRAQPASWRGLIHIPGSDIGSQGRWRNPPAVLCFPGLSPGFSGCGIGLGNGQNLIAFRILSSARPDRDLWVCSKDSSLEVRYYGTYVFDKSDDAWDTNLMRVDKICFWDLDAQMGGRQERDQLSCLASVRVGTCDSAHRTNC
jgi:hypothetical protein